MEWRWFDFMNNNVIKYRGWAFMDKQKAVTWVYRLPNDTVWRLGYPSELTPANQRTHRSARELKALVTAVWRLEGRILR